MCVKCGTIDAASRRRSEAYNEYYVEGKHTVTCEVCGDDREVSYAQFANVKTGRCMTRCVKCYGMSRRQPDRVRQWGALVANWNGNSKTRKYDWSIDRSYIENLWEQQEGRCALTDMPLSFETNNPFRVSLDRIDSTKGYIPGNVQLVCKDINYMKQEYKQDDFIRYCRLVVDMADRRANF